LWAPKTLKPGIMQCITSKGRHSTKTSSSVQLFWRNLQVWQTGRRTEGQMDRRTDRIAAALYCPSTRCIAQ